MEKQGAKLLPFYLVIDVSLSMDGKKLQSASKILPEVVDAIARCPILDDKVRVGLVDFSDDARVQLPLCQVLDPNLVLPGLAVRGGTSYVAAFQLLRKEIEANIAQLKADGFVVHRPAVFFISDGEPLDREAEWQAAFQELTGTRQYPNFIPFGIDDADPKVLRQLIFPATGNKKMQMYLQDTGSDAATTIAAIAEILISSIISSGTGMAQGGSGLILPPKDDLPSGVRSFTADDDDFM